MTKEKLTPVSKLFKSVFSLYFNKENWIFILQVVGVQILITIGVLLPLGLVAFGMGLFGYGATWFTDFQVLFGPYGVSLFLVVVILALSVIGFWLQAYIYVAIFHLAGDNKPSIRQLLREGWCKTGKYVGVSILTGLIIILGLLLIIIPGLVFAVWFSFAGMLVVVDNQGVLAAIRKSKQLISGYFWQVIGRYLIFGLIAFLVSFVLEYIPVIGPVIWIFFSPFFVLFQILLLKDLMRVKGSSQPVQ